MKVLSIEGYPNNYLRGCVKCKRGNIVRDELCHCGGYGCSSCSLWPYLKEGV